MNWLSWRDHQLSYYSFLSSLPVATGAACKTLVVNNLAFSATEEVLQSTFEKAVSIRIPQRDGRPKGWVICVVYNCIGCSALDLEMLHLLMSSSQSYPWFCLDSHEKQSQCRVWTGSPSSFWVLPTSAVQQAEMSLLRNYFTQWDRLRVFDEAYFFNEVIHPFCLFSLSKGLLL